MSKTTARTPLSTPALARRNFIKAGSSLMAFSSVSALASLNEAGIWQGLQNLEAGKAMVLFRDSDARASEFAAAFAKAGITTQALSQDPVRQWRDGLGKQISDQGLLVLGMGNWADYTIVRGLAAEQRRLPLLELQHAQLQDQRNWATLHAHDLMQACACDQASLRESLRKLAARGPTNTATPSMFSWVLA